MSLRSAAGSGGRAFVPGLPSGRSSTPRATWPGVPSPLPPSSRGAAVSAAAAIYRPLKERQRGQLHGAQRLTLAHQAHPGRRGYVTLVQAATTRTYEPIVPRYPDRGFRRPYNIPPIPGGGGGGGTQGGGGSSGGCCG